MDPLHPAVCRGPRWRWFGVAVAPSVPADDAGGLPLRTMPGVAVCQVTSQTDPPDLPVASGGATDAVMRAIAERGAGGSMLVETRPGPAACWAPTSW